MRVFSIALADLNPRLMQRVRQPLHECRIARSLFYLAYPRRIFLVCLMVLGGTMLLEYLQTLTPDRHGTLFDASEKIAGGVLGICAARVALNFGLKVPSGKHLGAGGG
jgi:hypothetical protein